MISLSGLKFRGIVIQSNSGIGSEYSIVAIRNDERKRKREERKRDES